MNEFLNGAAAVANIIFFGVLTFFIVSIYLKIKDLVIPKEVYKDSFDNKIEEMEKKLSQSIEDHNNTIKENDKRVEELKELVKEEIIELNSSKEPFKEEEIEKKLKKLGINLN